MKKARPGEKNMGEEEDWGLYYTYLLSYTSLTKETIKKSTIPFLQGIINKLPEVIKAKHGCPFLGVGTTAAPSKEVYKEAEKAPTVSAIEAFVRGG